MSALDVFTYSGQQVRTVLVDGEPWFVAADVCAILDHSNPTMALGGLDDDEKGLSNVETPGGAQSMAIVNEPGLYSLVIRSRKPEAREFRRWATHEVIPQIRKTGSYGVPALTDDQIVAQALQITVQRVKALESQVGELMPRAEAWDELASADGDYEVADAAKILARAGIDTGRQRLFEQLHEVTWIYRGPSGKWKCRQTAVDAGYLAEKPQSHHHPRTGELVLDPPQVRVTVKGLERLRVRLGHVLQLVESA